MKHHGDYVQALLEKLKELEREHPQAMQSPMMLTGSHAAELAGSKCLLLGGEGDVYCR